MGTNIKHILKIFCGIIVLVVISCLAISAVPEAFDGDINSIANSKFVESHDISYLHNPDFDVEIDLKAS